MKIPKNQIFNSAASYRYLQFLVMTNVLFFEQKKNASDHHNEQKILHNEIKTFSNSHKAIIIDSAIEQKNVVILFVFRSESTFKFSKRSNSYSFDRKKWLFFQNQNIFWNAFRSNELFPFHVIFDDYEIWKVSTSDFKNDERHLRWSINFQMKSLVDHYLQNIERPAKRWRKDQWKYIIVNEIKLHGKELRRLQTNRKSSQKTVASKKTFINRTRLQTNKSKFMNEIYAKRQMRIAIAHWNRHIMKKKNKTAVFILSNFSASLFSSITITSDSATTSSTIVKKRKNEFESAFFFQRQKIDVFSFLNLDSNRKYVIISFDKNAGIANVLLFFHILNPDEKMKRKKKINETALKAYKKAERARKKKKSINKNNIW